MRSSPNQACLSPTGRRRWALVGVAAVSLLLAWMLPASSATAGTFQDVPPGHWAAPFIDTITTAGIMEGCGGPFFCPDEVVTREDMAVWLERASRGAAFNPPPPTGLFQDVAASYCLAGWIEQLKNDGITAGCNANPPLYCPYSPVSRAEMAVFLLRLEHGEGYKLPDLCPENGSGSFSDVECSFWAADWIEQLYQEQITAGCALNPLQFCPYNDVTRAQMAVFIVRVCGKPGAHCAPW